MKISKVRAREILDSRGNPTIETEVYLEDGSRGVASVPSGIAVGKYEAVELRDNDPNRFNGQGMLKAVANVNQIIGPKILDMDASYQGKLDKFLLELDGTANKARLGANSIFSVSQAVLEASAVSYKMPTWKYLRSKYFLSNNLLALPHPTFNLINGGEHGAGNLDFQEFHIIPSSKVSYHEALEIAEEIYQNLKNVLIYRGAIHSVGDEGGFAPNLFTNIDALEILVEAIQSANYRLNRDVFIGLDAAANFFYKRGVYTIKDRIQTFKKEELIQYYLKLNNQYHLFSLEDPLQMDDWKGWQELVKKLAQDTLIVADDLLCTNKERVKKAIEKKACTAIVVKPNQTGTITETINVVEMAKKAGWSVIISHRSGETNDDFIADFSVGIGADYTKFGAPARGERIVKYNRLLKIEEELGNRE